ncbi:MAG: response regulator transcription factor [Clostridiales bacterium]|nr:response regulator transcription factor [Clostridiales bacterium]
MMRILIVEDNRRLAESIQDILKQSWYESDICMDGVTGQALLESGDYDAAILDLMLPGKDGITLLKEARAKGCGLPVLILTARSQVEDRVLGLESGADYYLTKPFDGQELLAVMKTLARRQGEYVSENLTYGDMVLNQSTFCLSGPAKSVQLGRKEYEVMRILMTNRESVVSKETILRRVWGSESEAGDNNVEIYISFLRKKMKFLRVQASIVTMRNLGYRLMMEK